MSTRCVRRTARREHFWCRTFLTIRRLRELWTAVAWTGAGSQKGPNPHYFVQLRATHESHGTVADGTPSPTTKNSRIRISAHPDRRSYHGMYRFPIRPPPFEANERKFSLGCAESERHIHKARTFPAGPRRHSLPTECPLMCCSPPRQPCLSTNHTRRLTPDAAAEGRQKSRGPCDFASEWRSPCKGLPADYGLCARSLNLKQTSAKMTSELYDVPIELLPVHSSCWAAP